ncbi:MAG: hypothetical protein ACM30G_04635 [Micromonosporaceae bacterium]
MKTASFFGYTALSRRRLDAHLPGKHDQGSHGRGGGVDAALAELPEGRDIHYHGTTDAIATLDREIFIAESKRAALGYLEGQAGTVYAIRLDPAARIASDGDLRSAGDDLWGSSEDHFGYRPYTYELADEPAVRGRLAELGFAGARFDDLGPDNAYQHPTRVVWDTSALGIVADVAVPEHDRGLATARVSSSRIAEHTDAAARFFNHVALHRERIQDRTYKRDPDGRF